MSGKLRTVRLLIRLYPAAWRREYGSELTGILIANPMSPRVVADVMRSAVRERGRRLIRPLWARAFVAFLAMEALFWSSFAARYVYGPGHELPPAMREFPSALAYGLFGAVMGAPFFLGPLLVVLVPAALMLRERTWLRSGWGTVVLALAISVPTVALVLVAGWIIDASSYPSLWAFMANILRFPLRLVVWITAFSAGAAILLAGSPSGLGPAASPPGNLQPESRPAGSTLECERRL